MCQWYTIGGKMSDKILEQQINIKFWYEKIGINIKFRVKIGKSASEILALLTVACGEYAMKISSGFEWHRRLEEGREYVQDDPRNGQQKTQRADANVERV
jgi:hypothetical protein